MKNEIARVEFTKEHGDKSDSGLVYIMEIHAYDVNDKEILTNEFIRAEGSIPRRSASK